MFFILKITNFELFVLFVVKLFKNHESLTYFVTQEVKF